MGQVETKTFGDNRQRETLRVSFEGVHTRTVYDDTATGSGRIQRQEKFMSIVDYTVSVNPNSYEVSEPELLRLGFQFHLNIRVASCFDER